MGEQAGPLDLWRGTPRGGSTPLRAGVVEHCADYSGDGARLVGVWIAVGASGVDGVPDLDATVTLFSLDNPAEPAGPYTERLAWAKQEWDAFARWATGHGVKLWPAQVWLTTLEVS